MAYPTVGNVNDTIDRFVYFNLTPFSANGTTPPYTYEGAGGDNNVFEIYNFSTQTSLTGSGIRLGQFQFSQSAGDVAPASQDINFYPRVLAGDVNGLTTGSVWLPIYGVPVLDPTILSPGDWLVITTGSNTSMTDVKEIKFYWTGSSTDWNSTNIAGVSDLKVLMSQVTNIPLNAGCWSYSNSSQAIRDAVTGSGAFILRWAGIGDLYDTNDSQWTFPPENAPSTDPLGFGTGPFNVAGGRVTQGSGPYVCYRARVYPAVFA
jgi:hypothetical protein